MGSSCKGCGALLGLRVLWSGVGVAGCGGRGGRPPSVGLRPKGLDALGRIPGWILGGSAQPRDLQDLAAVCGDRDEEIRNWSRGPDGKRTISTTTRRIPILPADVIRTLPFGTAVLLARTAPPILLDMTPWPDRQDASKIRASIALAGSAAT